MTFNEWLTQREGFSSRAERLYEDFSEVKDLAKLRKWLEAAYNEGQEHGYNLGFHDGAEHHHEVDF